MKEESPFDIPDGLSDGVPASLPGLVSDPEDVFAEEVPPDVKAKEANWARRSCGDVKAKKEAYWEHRSCGDVGRTSGYGSGGDYSSSSTGSRTRTLPTTVQTTRGHVRGVHAASSPSITRSGGLNLSINSVEHVATTANANPNISFRSEEDTAQFRTLDSSSHLAYVGFGQHAQVVVNKRDHLKRGESGFVGQQDELMRRGDSAVKESEKLGGWEHDVYTANVIGVKSARSASNADDAVNAYTTNAKKFKEIRTHCIQYDFMQLLYILKAKPGITTDADALSDEELRHTKLGDLVDLESKGSSRDMFKDWANLTVDEVKLMQRIYNMHPAVMQEDRDSNGLLYQLVRNYLTIDFRESVDRAYNKTFSAERGEVGGITYLFAVLRKVLIGTRASVDILFAELSKFFSVGPSYLNGGENIVALVWHVKTVLIEPIASMQGFDPSRGRPIESLLQALAKSSCPAFADYFKALYSPTNTSSQLCLRQTLCTLTPRQSCHPVRLQTRCSIFLRKQ